MSHLSDKRNSFIRESWEVSGGNVSEAIKLAEEKYQKYVGRYLSFGEYQHIEQAMIKLEKNNRTTTL